MRELRGVRDCLWRIKKCNLNRYALQTKYLTLLYSMFSPQDQSVILFATSVQCKDGQRGKSTLLRLFSANSAGDCSSIHRCKKPEYSTRVCPSKVGESSQLNGGKTAIRVANTLYMFATFLLVFTSLSHQRTVPSQLNMKHHPADSSPPPLGDLLIYPDNKSVLNRSHAV